MGRAGVRGAARRLIGTAGGLLLAGLVALPGAATARVPPGVRTVTSTRSYPDTQLTPSGTVSYLWTATAALGCQALGLCGSSGAVTIDVVNADFQGGPGGGLNLQTSATARTRGPAPGTSCVDPLDPTGVGVDLPVARSPFRLFALGAQYGPSAGRCAGPLASDLVRLALPLRRRGRGFDLRRTASETAGPYEVTLDSSLVLRPTPGPPGGYSTSSGSITGSFSGGGGPGSGRRPRIEHVALVDAIAPTGDPLQLTFSAAPFPFCLGLGACGSQGTIRLSLQTPTRPLSIEATETVRHPRRPAAVLRDLASGRAPAFGQVSLPASVTETVTTPGQPTCTDTRTVTLSLQAVPAPPPAAAGGPLSFTAGRLTLSLTDEAATALRTYCPGPLESDILSNRNGPPPFATTPVPASALGPGPAALALAPARGFAGAVYSGQWSGRLGLSLTRRSLRVSMTGGGR